MVRSRRSSSPSRCGGGGSTAPYGHDGRSINLDEVIRRHGGEAEQSSCRYQAMSEQQREALRGFLRSLVLFAPLDTASTLNAGTPGSANPQDPAEHGSIDLRALFQFPAEGPE